MPDPVSVGAVGLTGGYVVKRGLDAAERVLGKSGDAISEWLAQWTTQRLENVGRIVENAERKLPPGTTGGSVPPRVAHRILEEGSWCDEDVMVEYLGGVLAASHTDDGRDDRAVSWATVVAGMSTQQVRAHFLLYRTWDRLLRGRSDIPVAFSGGREQANLHVEIHDFLAAMGTHDRDYEPDVLHCITGLVRVGLLGEMWAVGGPNETAGPHAGGFKVMPSVAGFELYGWAMGMRGLKPEQMARLEVDPLQTDPPYPDLNSAVMPAASPPT